MPGGRLRRVLCLVLLPAAAAQEVAEMTSREQPAVFRSSVNRVLVPVVVRDSQGRAIGDLRKEDFRLFDKGKPQDILEFSAEKRAAPGAGPANRNAVETAAGETVYYAAPDRFVAYLFDDIHLDTPGMMLARQAASRHIETALGADTRAAIFTTSGRDSLDFTADQPLLRQTIAQLNPRPSKTCDEVDYFIADRVRDVEHPRDPDALALMDLQIGSCGGVTVADDGYLNMILRRALTAGERDTRASLAALDAAVRRMATMPGQRTVVLISPGFIDPDSRDEEGRIIDRAIRAKVAVSTLDPRGLVNPLAADPAVGRISPTFIPNADGSLTERESPLLYFRLQGRYASEAGAAGHETLAALADGTGGIDFRNNNDVDEGLRRIASPPEFSYVLAFAPQNLKYDGAFHNLKVTLSKSGGGYVIQARRGYYAPSQLVNAAEQAKEEIREALFSRDELRDIPLDVRTQFFKPNLDSAKVTVVVRVDPKPLRFRKSESRNWDDLTLVAALFDRDGNFVAARETLLQMRLKEETLGRVLDRGLTVRSGFDTIPGIYQVRVVVRDSEGQVMAAQNAAVEIP